MKQQRSQCRVVHVTSAHSWTDNRIHLREAATLAKAGYRVALVAVASDQECPPSGVTVIKRPARARLARFTVGSLVAVVSALRLRGRIYHLHDPELAWAVPLLRCLGKVVIYDAHEDLPSQVADKRYIPRPLRPVFRLLTHALVHLADLANQVVAATEPISVRYRPGHVTVIHNYPIVRSGETDLAPLAERDHLVTWAGRISEESGAAALIRATGTPQWPQGWRLVMAGSVEPQLAHLFEAPKLRERIEYLGLLSPGDARRLVGTSRVGVLAPPATRANLGSMPTKLFEYLAAGVPVVTASFPMWRSMLEPYDCSVFAEVNSPEAIAAAIHRYADDLELWQRHGTNARRAADEVFNWDREAGRLVGLYDSLLKSGPDDARDEA
jgi:glycosyltransferase involved in cell wall biosynthesis